MASSTTKITMKNKEHSTNQNSLNKSLFLSHSFLSMTLAQQWETKKTHNSNLIILFPKQQPKKKQQTKKEK
jgi:hypothetical protein